jgi:amino acid adenylation domain-containing protein
MTNKNISIFGKQSKQEKEYWLNKLSSPDVGSHVLLDHERPNSCPPHDALVQMCIPADTLSKLTKLTGNSTLLTYTVLLTALKICLHEYSGSAKVAVGSPARRKSEEDSQHTNVVTIVTEINEQVSVQQLLTNVRQNLLDAYANQTYPFEQLLQALKMSDMSNRCPLFDVAAVMEGLHLPLPAVNNDITFVFSQGDGDLYGKVHYSSSLFNRESIENLSQHFTRMLCFVLDNTSACVSAVSLVGEAERDKLLLEWNRTQTDYESSRSILELFHLQVERCPEATAISCESRSLTYRELHLRSNQLAHYLQKLGVGPETVVGISAERSLEMIIGVLGILQAGAAYLPLDPSHPKQRLAYMLATARPLVLLTQQRLVERLPSSGARIVCLDTDWPNITGESEQTPICLATSDNLAYIIFTSGSTGQPKAVAVTHRGLCNVSAAQAHHFRVQSSDRVLQFASLNFDAAVFEIVMALCSGATLCLPGQHSMLAGSALVDLLRNERITNVTVTPSVLMTAPVSSLPELKTVIAAGDVCPAELVERWADGRELFNAYGPTEVTIWATVERCIHGNTKPSIGRPISNTSIYILNHKHNLSPVGVPGEIYIGGVGVARGYLNQADLTAERYVPDNFSGEAGARLYKTGDLGRYKANGEIEFLGRIDGQIKLRGFRIELGEIEKALREEEKIADAAVIVRGDTAEGERLVAYVVGTNGSMPNASTLRSNLKERLPEYMVPSFFVVLDALPLNVNGKLDRNALPAPQSAGTEPGDAYNAPQTPVEEMLCGIWAGWLEVKQVGIDDNFFEVGGHSLLATAVISEVREVFGVEVPVSSVFDKPTVRELARLVETALEAQDGSPSAPRLQSVSRAGLLALSFAQQRLWFIDQMEPGNTFYNLPVARRLCGTLNVEALREAFTEVVRRHEVLRTSFTNIDGQPWQVIAEPKAVPVPITDLSNLTFEERETEVRRQVHAEAQQAFDLQCGPVLRVRLLKLAEDEHVLLLTLHHVASDAWSMGVLFRELSALYNAFSEGRPSSLAELPVQYADYAAWQRQYLQGDVFEQQLNYWKEHLGGAPGLLELPTDRPRPAVQTNKGAIETFSLPKELSVGVKQLSQREGVTLFMTLLAAFQVLLSRYSGQEDIVVGSPIAGRNRKETEGLIGFFVNTLALRAGLSGEPTFRQVLASVRKACLGAYAHQDIPFERLVEELRPERSLSHQPLFQVMFHLQEAERGEQNFLSGLKQQSFKWQSETAKFDLLLAMDDAETLSGLINYNTDLFDAETVRRFCGHFQQLLESAVSTPERRISELQFVTAAEQQQLVLWGEAITDDLHANCIHHLFEQQAARTPEATALIFKNEQLTYRELNARANRLAHYLVKQGVGPESLVGVLLERSPAMAVALLAILKAGAAYLPLDPAYPPERLSFMLEDAHAHAVVTQQTLLDRVAGSAAKLICVDTEAEQIDGMDEQNLATTVTSSNLSYVIYTSGSTGRPKGVAITHKSAAVMLHWARRAFSDDELQCVLFSTSICFDLSVFELFAPLSWGGSVLLVENALALATLSEDAPPTLINTVPSAMTELLRVHGVPRNVRVVNLAGEALSGQLVEAIYELPQIEKVWNLYGPTEDTTYSTGAVMSREGRPTIGWPLDGTRAFVMDQWMGLAPVGVPGELYLGGEGLARGYLGRPELTADRFVPDPFSKKEGARLYRTGDVVRYQADGQLEFFGRGDQQVKLRGYRIELGEVEAALAGHENVREAVAVVHKAKGGIEQLIAYVVLSEAEIDTESLRRHLRSKLPEFMIPAFFVKLNEMPLTPNGKLDRRALPAPDYTQSKLEAGYVAPRTPVEEVLCEVWAEVLGVERVGVFDSFFELGGHSLMATRLVSRVRKIFGIDLPLRAIFEEPTVAGLAEQTARAEGLEQRSTEQPLVTIPREGLLKLSFAQQRLWFLHQLEPRSPVYNLPLVLRLTGSLNITALEKALNEIVRRHESLRTNFGLLDGEPIQVITPETKITLPITDLRGVETANQRARVSQLAIEQWQQPFDLWNELLLRCDLVAIDELEHVLLVTIHHIVTDGWSMGIFMRELTALYNAFSEDKPSPLAELPVQYADYAVWQRERLQGEVLEDQLSYWKQQLAGTPAILELPTDHPRPALRTYRGAAESFKLPEDLNRQLHELSRREGATLFMTLLASFQVLLARYSGQNDVVVGAPIAGRGRLELEGLIGFFVNTLALRVDLSGDPDFTEVLRRVRSTCLSAYAHQEVPFERLVEELHPERSLSRQPLFQVMFQLRNGVSQAQQPLKDLVIQGMNQDRDATKFDLTLSVMDDGTAIQGRMEYSTELFEAETVRRMIGHWQALLTSVTAEPNRAVSELSLLDVSERQMLAQWNDTGADYPTGAFIHELIERQAIGTPDSVALVFEDVSLTYRELNERANQLAHYLLSSGIGRQSLVGVLMHRSSEMVVSLLAILKTGAAYLPLDPDYPQQRVSFMLQHAQVPLVLTQEELADRLTGSDATPVCVDQKWNEIGVHSTSNFPSTVSADDLAYVIYTSGSTGLPKAAMNTHGGILNRLLWMQETYQLNQTDSVLQKTPFSFDVSVWEFFWPLMTGARLVLARPGGHRDSAYLVKLIEEQQITTLHFVPSMLQVFLEERDLEKCSSLRRVICSGEALSYGLQERFFDRMSAELHNLYGPTEAAIDVTAWTCERTNAQQVVPIGRPIANTHTYVLDERMQLAPVGVVRELYLGGVGLARGYLGEPALTAEKFVPDLYSQKAGARLYATGDLARYNRDGILEYWGRRDHQVKIRGFRIELGEVEAALHEQAQINEAIVISQDDGSGAKRLVAFVVAASEAELNVGKLREDLRDRLPDYMIPNSFVPLEEIPLTPNGKVDRKALSSINTQQALRPASAILPRTDIEAKLARLWQQVLQVETVSVVDNFFDLGGHSLMLARLGQELQEVFPVELQLVDLFKYPTVELLAGFISQKLAGRDLRSNEQKQSYVPKVAESISSTGAWNDSIAIIGMSCRFPGAANVGEYWQNLRDGKETISHFSDEELLSAGISADVLAEPNYVKAKGVLEDIEMFDAQFFGFSPKEAEIMDPQHRLFLECAWHALENAGYDPDRYHGRIGVYAGESMSSYFLRLLNNPEVAALGGFPLLIGNDKDFLASRVCYKLNLKGPGVVVQSACSTSLVAVSMACQSLLNQQADIVLAGGVSIGVPQKKGYYYNKEGILSSDGHCRAFDRRAEGTVSGDGVGIVVLKRLSQALADGDVIHAVIKGTAINNDGSVKIGYTAPSVTGQAQVISEAQAIAGVEPESISYVETHGSGTRLGDPIEVAALTEVFGTTDAQPHCALGSVKTNIGHLDAAAGVAGLIKTVLALKHKQLPPSLHFEEPNPEISFARSPFFINARLRPWEIENGVRRAGVSSFGLGGTNAHAIVEEAPLNPESGESRPYQLLSLSAKSESALRQLSIDLAEFFRTHPDMPLADAAYTAHLGRKAFKHRQAIVCRDLTEAVQMLDGNQRQGVICGEQNGTRPAVTFMFSGLGDHYPGMGRELYQQEQTFRETVDRCAELLEPELGVDIRKILYPATQQNEHVVLGEISSTALDLRRMLKGAQAQETDEDRDRLNRTAYAQPAVFVTEYALAQLLIKWGIVPEAVIGYSIGEYVAACLAGVFSLEDALKLVARRARMIEQLPRGAMLAVPFSEQKVQPWLGVDLSLAATNGPALTVVSGSEAAIARFERDMEDLTVTRRLQTTHAFHSSMMETLAPAFTDLCADIKLNEPRIRLVSNVTGTWITAAQATDPAYWGRHLCETVRFGEGLETLHENNHHVLVEVGPGQSLSSLVAQRNGELQAIPTLRHEYDLRTDLACLLGALGRLWTTGVEVDWGNFHATERRRRVELPTYPFERQRYWVDPPRQTGRQRKLKATGADDLAESFHVPYWKPRAISIPARDDSPNQDAKNCLMFLDQLGLGVQLANRLEQSGWNVIMVTAGERFASMSDRQYVIDHRSSQDYDALLSELGQQKLMPSHIVHLCSLTGNEETQREANYQDSGFYSLLFLAQAIGNNTRKQIHINVVTNKVSEVSGREPLCPEKATVLGAIRVIPQEYGNVTCRSIDIEIPSNSSQEQKVTDQLMGILIEEPVNDAVALRGNGKWVQEFEPVRLEAAEKNCGLREHGVYLITGGVGGIGLVLAEHLVRSVGARLILTSHSALPPRTEWQQFLEEHQNENLVSSKLRKLLALEAMGAEVEVMCADVGNPEQMLAVVQRACERFGAINGVIHAAGIAGGGLVQLKTVEMAEKVLHPKVKGTLVLDEVLRDQDLDFMMLCSSVTSELGGFGEIDYAGANAFLDAFARARSRQGQPTVSVNWDVWREVGLAINTEVPQDFQQIRAEGIADGFLNTEGAEAFSRVLSTTWSQVVVSRRDFQRQVEWHKRLKIDEALTALKERQSVKSAHERPRLSSEYEAPTNDLEKGIVEIWEELLGIKGLGIYDNFFELGGHSLLGTMLMTRLREMFQLDLPLRTLFEAPTVAELTLTLQETLINELSKEECELT